MRNVYEKCPIYETETFLLRQVKMEDAQDLLVCYSDKENVAKLNADCCTSDFYYNTLEQMENCIRFWLREYEMHYYVRFAVVLKESGRAIGTVEIFGGEAGVLRVDLAAEYNTEQNYAQLLTLAKEQFAEDFGVGSIKIKSANIPERVSWLEAQGFVASKTFRPEFGYHEWDMGVLEK